MATRTASGPPGGRAERDRPEPGSEVIVVALSQRQQDVIDASTAAAPDLNRESLAALREAFADVVDDASGHDAA